MADVFLFAGTIEGKLLAEGLLKAGIGVRAFTATEYGGSLLQELDPAGYGQEGDRGLLQISSQRMDEEQMCAAIEAEGPKLLIDATHPYAVEVSANIRRAAGQTGIRLIRLERAESGPENRLAREVHVASVEEAVDFLAREEGRVLLTCGSKELAAFTALDDYENRLYARVLSTAEVVDQCSRMGFVGKHLIAMQGPFSLEMNQALIRHIGADWLVTKESGRQGGYPEKAMAASEEGIGLLVIDRPKNAGEEGAGERTNDQPWLVCHSVDACLQAAYTHLKVRPRQHFTLLGIGPGNAGGLTEEGRQALVRADVVFGANRMLDILEEILDPDGAAHGKAGDLSACRQADQGAKRKEIKGKPVFVSWKPEEMCRYAADHPQYRNVVVALSGDPGFYSGAAKLLEVWKDEEVEVLPGLSTLQVLCSRARVDWQQVCCISRHGRAGSLLAALRTHEQVFLLPGESLPDLCGKLLEAGYDQVRMVVGSKLSYPDEQVLSGNPQELKTKTVAEPYAALIYHEAARDAVITPGIPDEAFQRIRAGQEEKAGRTVPMTKEEVRVISLAKLGLTKQALVYDIGAGTGSVSIEAARIAWGGRVYAIESNPRAVALLAENKKKFGADNLEIIEGMAPEALRDLPAPTHAFIGGSKGNLKEIVALLQEKNPTVRIVITAVTVETAAQAHAIVDAWEAGDDGKDAGGSRRADVVQIAATRERKVATYHMLQAENPITIFSLGGK